MTHAILLTRPNHDLITTYLFHWSVLVIKEANRRGIVVLDLAGEKAAYKNLESYISRHQPTFVFFNGHGNKKAITGYDDAPLLETGNNENLLSGKVVYARSCDAGSYLGYKCVQSGTIAFIGYKKKFALGYSPSKTSDPLNDEIAALFLEPSNLIPISFIKGNFAKDAYRKAQETMGKNLRFMLSTKATSAQKDAAPYLWSNRKHQILLGDATAKM